jgi:hypothetical protein
MIALMEFFSSAPKREPSADQRKSADDLHAMYTSYVDAGFSKEQAMQIVCSTISAVVSAQHRPPAS